MDIGILKPRVSAITAVRYLIITPEYPANAFFPPREFSNPFLYIIRHLPKNLVQLNDRTTQWIAIEWSTFTYSGVDVQVIYEKNIDFILSHLSDIPVTVIFIDKGVSDRNSIIQKVEMHGLFFYLLGEFDPLKRQFDSILTLLSLLKLQTDEINEHYKKHGLTVQLNFDQQIPEDFREVNKLEYFIPSRNNFCILNQYIGNVWHDPGNDLEDTDEASEIERRTEGSMRKDRILIVDKQIDLIDRFRIVLMEPEDKPKTITNAPRFTPLIVVAPFHYPAIDDVFPEESRRRPWYKIIKELYRSEQDLGYHGSIKAKELDDPEEFFKSMRTNATLLGEKSSYLDDTAYLHASFTYSPVLRLPIKGPSFNKYIAIFNPDTPNPSASKFYRMVQEFGEEYVRSAIHPKLIPQFVKKDRQLVCISDLPVEWFSIEGVPLSFTHDVARIPELSYGGIMATYVRNAIVEYTIPENILQNTLVMLTVPTDNGRNKEFDKGFRVVEMNSGQFGYKTVRCLSLEDAKSAIEKFRPALLIIDTHGKTLKKDKSTVLQFGNNWIGGGDIIRHGITAPLVILSACNTIPNGYFNPISNAFLEAGALAVTGTFLPIGIISGTVLYQRVLHNLNIASVQPIHQNWLNYIAHCIRTQYMFEVQNMVLGKIAKLPLVQTNKEKLAQKARDLTARLLTISMHFGSRRDLFKRLLNEYNKLHSGIKINQSSLSMEQLLYTTIGRPDLIFFESWLKKYKTDLHQS